MIQPYPLMNLIATFRKLFVLSQKTGILDHRHPSFHQQLSVVVVLTK